MHKIAWVIATQNWGTPEGYMADAFHADASGGSKIVANLKRLRSVPHGHQGVCPLGWPMPSVYMLVMTIDKR